MNVNVRVYHNIARDEVGRAAGFDGYQSEHPVTQVFATTVDASNAFEACDQIYRLLNVGDDPDFTTPPDPRALAYRARGNRSLSVGDLVEVDGVAYASTPAGWTAVVEPRLVEVSAAGSTHSTEVNTL